MDTAFSQICPRFLEMSHLPFVDNDTSGPVTYPGASRRWLPARATRRTGRAGVLTGPGRRRDRSHGSKTSACGGSHRTKDGCRDAGGTIRRPPRVRGRELASSRVHRETPAAKCAAGRRCVITHGGDGSTIRMPAAARKSSDPHSPARPAPLTAHRPPARWPLAAPARCKALAARTTRERRSACAGNTCRFRAVPESSRARHRAPAGSAGHVRRSHPHRTPDTGVAATRRHTRQACIRPPDMG